VIHEKSPARLLRASRFHLFGGRPICARDCFFWRNPLHAALMGASYIIQHATADPKCIQSAARIKNNIKRCDQLVSDLLDYARSALGRGLPISPQDANMRVLCAATIEELEAANPGRLMLVRNAS
jgi:signal transduction histidine kinase